MTWIALALQLLQLLPNILQTIQQVEQVFAGAQGQGAVKKALVLAPVKASGAPENVVSTVSNIIDTTVGALNSAGVFKNSPKS